MKNKIFGKILKFFRYMAIMLNENKIQYARMHTYEELRKLEKE